MRRGERDEKREGQRRRGETATHGTAGFWVNAIALAPLTVHGLRGELTLVMELAGETEGGGKVVLGDAAVGCFARAGERRKG